MTLTDSPRLIKHKYFHDLRGDFFKVWPPIPQQTTEAHEQKIWKENFFTRSAKSVVRGLHFQAPPKAQWKLVTCLSGEIFDVVIDLRQNSPEFGRPQIFELSGSQSLSLLIPPGFAHGFQSLSDSALVNYLTDQTYAAPLDLGISWRCAESLWPLPVTVLSERDENLPLWGDFLSPF